MTTKQDGTKGRKPLTPVAIEGDVMEKGALAERGNELQELAKAEAAVRKLAENIGYAGSLDVQTLWSAVEFRQRRSVEDLLEMGRGLLLIKEQTAHGEFMGECGRRGIHQRVANRFMSVALKFSKVDSKSILAAAGTQTKVLELTILDDDEIEALNSGESVSGITLDDVERMSASQLREALRTARADKDAKDLRIKKLAADVNRAEEKAILLPRMNPDAKAAQMLGELESSYAQARAALRNVSECTGKFLEYANQKALNFDEDVDARAVELSNLLLGMVVELHVRGISKAKANALMVLGG